MMVTRPKLLPVVAILTASLLGACSLNTGLDPKVEAEALRPMADASQSLANSADRASKAQEDLVRIQTARTLPAPAPVDETLAGVPDELRRPTTLQWTGPGAEAAAKIAVIIGYGFRVVGNPPATLPTINVSADGIPAVKVLEDIGNQVQPFAQLVVDAKLKRMEYRYLATSGSAFAPSRPPMTK